MVLGCNKCTEIFLNCYREIHEYGSHQKLLRTSDILLGSDKGWTRYSVLSVHIHPILHAPLVEGRKANNYVSQTLAPRVWHASVRSRSTLQVEATSIPTAGSGRNLLWTDFITLSRDQLHKQLKWAAVSWPLGVDNNSWPLVHSYRLITSKNKSSMIFLSNKNPHSQVSSYSNGLVASNRNLKWFLFLALKPDRNRRQENLPRGGWELYKDKS